MVLEINLASYALLFGLLGAQTAALLWAAGKVMGLATKPKRVGLAAAAGAAYAVAVDLAGFGVLPGANFLGAWYTVILASALTYALAYWPLPAGRRLSAVAAYYFLAIVGAGVGYAAFNLGLRGWVPPLLTTGAVLAAAELGWGVVQRWVWDRVVHLPVEIDLLGRTARVTALLDTGNSLVDPLTGQAVVVLSADLREALLPPEAVEPVARAVENPSEAVSLLAETPLASRLRLVPFSTVGRENGLLLAFRADAVRLSSGDPVDGPVLIAFHTQPLDSSGAYRALVHPALLHRNLTQASRRSGRLVLDAGIDPHLPLSRPGG